MVLIYPYLSYGLVVQGLTARSHLEKDRRSSNWANRAVSQANVLSSRNPPYPSRGRNARRTLNRVSVGGFQKYNNNSLHEEKHMRRGYSDRNENIPIL